MTEMKQPSRLGAEIYEVIESKVWRCDDGRTASPYGALPWSSDSEAPRWQLIVRGYTVRDHVRGTVGIGRPPWPTCEEAQAWIDAEVARRAVNAEITRKAVADETARRAEIATKRSNRR